MHVEELGVQSKQAAMAERQEVGLSEGTPAADMYPRKILEYMEGFLVSKVIFTRSAYTHTSSWVKYMNAPLLSLKFYTQ